MSNIENASGSKDTALISSSHYGRFRDDPLNFMIRLTAESTAFAAGSGWRAYERYIGQPILYSNYTSEIYKELRGKQEIQSLIKDAAAAQFTRLSSENKKKSYCKKRVTLRQCERAQWKAFHNIVVGMMATMSSMRSVKMLTLVVNHILIRLFHQGIHIRESEWTNVRNAAVEAARRKVSLIFLPCHKSHVDYLVISYVLYRMGVAIPHIAAGDNLSLPVVGGFMKCGGAFFIRRSWNSDPFYTQIMTSYIEILLQHGFNIEFFIEGTRSRIGKLLAPKLGILRIIVEAVLRDRVQDAILVPVSTGYDKIIETSTYVSELMGQPKESESLSALMKSTKLLGLKWGRIDVRFNKPYSIKEFLQSEIERRGGAKVFAPLTNAKDKSTLLLTLGYRILAQINEVSVIMATALVGTVILTLRGGTIGRSAMIRRVKWLQREILAKKGHTTAESDSHGYLADLVDQSIAIMGNFISVTPGLIEPVYTPLKRFELAYYRNQVLHLFLHESILAAALYGTLKRSTQARHELVSRTVVDDDTRFLSQLLKAEFIFKPGGFEQNMEETVQYLVKKNVIETQNQFVSLHPAEKELGRENFDFYCFLIWPFIETYWLAALGLFLLLPESTIHPREKPDPSVKWVEEKTFITALQALGQNIYAQGDMTYREAINKELLLNALKRFQQFGIVQMYSGSQPPSDLNHSVYSSAAQSRSWQREASVHSYLSTQYLALSSSSIDGPAAAKYGSKTENSKESSDEFIDVFESRFYDRKANADELSKGNILKKVVAVHSRPAKASSSAGPPNNSQVWIRLFPNWCFAPEDEQSILSHKTPATPGPVSDGKLPKVLESARLMCEYRYRWPRQFSSDFFSSRLWNLAETIGRFRREGKQRRDNLISAERVLCIAGVLEAQYLSFNHLDNFNTSKL